MVQLPAPFLHGFDELEADLVALRGRSVTAFFNSGNRGDGLIHLAGRRLFARLGLTVREVYQTDLTPGRYESLGGDTLLVFANGAFCREAKSLLRHLPGLLKRFDSALFLPGTYDPGYPPVARFLRSLDRRHTLYCREERSYVSLQKLGLSVRALRLTHDLAFLLDLEDWARRPHAGECAIFRRDEEIAAEPRPEMPGTTDASAGLEKDYAKLLDHVARYSRVHSDRTHGAIAAALMGREVIVYNNSYFKNEAMFAHSLRHFPKVRFASPQPVRWRDRLRRLYWARLRGWQMKFLRAWQLVRG